MTIKDMEARSGMTRANIRFYEAEGLLQPVRTENGYRDYSEEDLTALKRIRLLRMLGVPLEEIKRVQDGREELSSVLKSRQEELEKEQLQTEICRRVCREMQEDQVRYDTLNAQKYLDSMSGPSAVPVPTSDQVVQPWVPWRRLFARSFDVVFYRTLWVVVFCVGFHVSYSRFPFDLLTFLTLILVEPLLLSKFGTTLGKWIFGISVTNEIGGKLSYQKAFLRLMKCLWWGYGLGIPVFHLVRLAICYNSYRANQVLPWEYESEELVKDVSSRRVVVMAVSIFSLALVLYGSFFLAMWPRHWGKLTVAQFCENYNSYSNYYNIDSYRLDSTGNWERDVIYDMDTDSWPGPSTLHFETDAEGYITAISWEESLQTSAEEEMPEHLWSIWEYSKGWEMERLSKLMVLSYAAPRGIVLFRLDEELSPLNSILSESMMEYGGFYAEVCCTKIEFTFDASNFAPRQEGDVGYRTLPGKEAHINAKLTLKRAG